MAKRRQAKEQARVRIQRMRAAERARQRRRNLAWFGGGGIVVAGLVAAIIVAVLPSAGSSHEVIPPAPTGTTTVQPPPLEVANTTGITDIVAYDTTGWPATSHNGPKARALRHTHVTGPVTYAVTPPVGGDHSPTWLNCGIYDKPVPNENAVHDLEHGAIWITYRPFLPPDEVSQLRAFAERQTIVSPGGQSGSRYMDLSPYPGAPAPIVASSWGFQLRLASPTDPRLQQFVSKFRVSRPYTPEYGGPCTGGAGTPLQR